jgi:hypothetical protein
MSMSASVGVLLLVLCTAFLILYVTYLYLRRLQKGDRGPKSFGQWLRDLLDVAFGLG